MRDDLVKGIARLCELYPGLDSSIRYSDKLSQEQVDVFSAFVNGHVERVLKEFMTDESVQSSKISALLSGSTGVSRIRAKDVLFVESLLSSASGSDSGISPEMRDLVDFLRSHKSIWWALHDSYECIVKSNLVDTCPLVVSKPSFIARILPFGSKYNSFQEFNKLFHESVHFVLEENGICFNDEELDEGLVTFFHEEVMGKSVCYLHYSGDVGKNYLKYADDFRKILASHPKSDTVPFLKRFVKENVIVQ